MSYPRDAHVQGLSLSPFFSLSLSLSLCLRRTGCELWDEGADVIWQRHRRPGCPGDSPGTFILAISGGGAIVALIYSRAGGGSTNVKEWV